MIQADSKMGATISAVTPKGLLFAMVVIASVSVCACGVTTLAPPAVSDCRSLIDAHLEGRTTDDFTSFEALDMETKYRVFLCGMQHVEPPEVGLQTAFAQEGEDAVPFLLAKLEEAPNDMTKADIVGVFWQMQFLGTYSVRDDERAMVALLQAVEDISSPSTRLVVETLVDDIQEGSVAQDVPVSQVPLPR